MRRQRNTEPAAGILLLKENDDKKNQDQHNKDDDAHFKNESGDADRAAERDAIFAVWTAAASHPQDQNDNNSNKQKNNIDAPPNNVQLFMNGAAPPTFTARASECASWALGFNHNYLAQQQQQLQSNKEEKQQLLHNQQKRAFVRANEQEVAHSLHEGKTLAKYVAPM